MTRLLEMRGISKRYDATLALRSVDFALERGQVHGLVGENGAGKSTLVKVLTGAVEADAGEIFLEGARQRVQDPLSAQRLGIRVVHQHLSLVPHLTVTENIFLGSMPRTRGGWWIDWREAQRRSRRVLEELGFAGIDVRQSVSRLSHAQRKIVEIAKAVVTKPRILILDEPTAALSHEERERLFTLVRRLQAQDASVLYISHDLDEVFEISDRVTVLRDGAVVVSVSPGECDPRLVIEWMAGRVVDRIYPQRTPAAGAEVLRVSGLGANGRFEDVSFSVAAGEIVGVYGLIGSGRTEVARCIFGADRYSTGQALLGAQAFMPRSPQEAMKAGVAMLTEDRTRDGLVLFLSVCDNVTLANFERMSRGGVLSRSRQRALVEAKIAELRVRPAGIERRVRTLSGGNQQKVVLAKWLLREARLLILDEPTWGVDIAAKQEIYGVIAKLAASGVGILLISSELPEILGMSDRILVMRKGRLVGEFPRANATQESLLACATGVGSAGLH